MLKRASLNNGAHQHFYQSASHRIDDHTDQYSGKWAGEQVWQDRQTDQPHPGQKLGDHNAFSIPYVIHDRCTKDIYHYLRNIKHGRNQSDFPKRNIIFVMESQKQQGGKIRHNCLCDETDIAGYQRPFIIHIFRHVISNRPRFLLLGYHITKNNEFEASLSPRTGTIYPTFAAHAACSHISF